MIERVPNTICSRCTICTRSTHTLAFARSLVRSFYRRRLFRHASDDRASDARVDRRGGAAGSFAFAAAFFFAVVFAAGLVFFSPAVFSAGRGVFRGLPTARFRTHSLRRGGATALLTACGPAETVTIVGRWASLQSAKIYLKLGLALRANVEAQTSERTKQLIRALVARSVHVFAKAP